MSDEIIEQPVSPVTVDIPAVVEAPVEEAPKGNKFEEAAKAKGWRPKEEFSGDPEEFRPAKEWLERGELLDTIHGLNRKAKEQDETIGHLVEFNKKIEEVTRERTIADIQHRHRSAVEIGDVAGASAAAEELVRATYASPKVNVAHTPPVAPEAAAFAQRNSSWFNNTTAENEAMVRFAVRRDAELMESIPGLTPAQSLEMVEKEVKKTFAHKFVGAPVSAVSAPTMSPAKTKETDLRSLPDFHVKMIKRLEASIKNFDRKDYIDNLKKAGQI